MKNAPKRLSLFLVLAGFALAQSGEPAPDFKLVTINNEIVKLSSLKGKPVVVNFWASWCGPCKQEMPEMQSVYEKFKDKFTLLAIAVDEPTSNSQQFFKDNKFTYTLLTDAPTNFATATDTTKSVKRAFKANQGIPHSFFIDSNGIIQATRIGAMNQKNFEYFLGFIDVEQK